MYVHTEIDYPTIQVGQSRRVRTKYGTYMLLYDAKDRAACVGVIVRGNYRASAIQSDGVGMIKRERARERCANNNLKIMFF